MSLLLIVVIMAGLSFVSISVMRARLETEARAVVLEELNIDRKRVLRFIKDNALCDPSNIDPSVKCTASPSGKDVWTKDSGNDSTIDLKNVLNRDFFLVSAANGSKKIGRFNVRVRCRKDPNALDSAQWVIEIGRFSTPDGVPPTPNDALPDALSRKKPAATENDAWKPILKWEQMCGSKGSGQDYLVLASTSCYGGLTGNVLLPTDIRDALLKTYNSSYALKALFLKPPQKAYCSDLSRPYPNCPAVSATTGLPYRKLLQYIDRYGWGGRDMTAYSQCQEVLWDF